MMRAAGNLRASSAVAVMRSAASLRSGSPRAAATSGPIAPPSTTMPVGGPCAGSHAGKRSSSGSIKALPSGDSPARSSSATPSAAIRRPARLNRVNSSTMPRVASVAAMLEGSAKKPRTLERTKNMRDPRASLRGARNDKSPPLFPLLVAFLRLVVGRIEARELHALLDLAHHPGLVALVLLALGKDEVDQVLRDHHRAVIVGDDQVAREDRATAAGNWLVPAHEGEPVDRGGCRRPGAPHRQPGREHAGLVADHPVGDERGDAALRHPHHQDVTEDAGG